MFASYADGMPNRLQLRRRDPGSHDPESLWAIAACSVVSLAGVLVLTMSIQHAWTGMSAAGTRPIAVTPAGVLIGLAGVGACWLLAAVRPVPSLGLCSLSLSWLVVGLSGWTLLPAAVRAVAATAGDLAVAGAAVLAVCWVPSGRAERRLLVVCLSTVGAATLLRAASYDPFLDPACWHTCVSRGTGWGWPGSSILGALASGLAAIGWCAALLGCVRCPAPRLLRSASIGSLAALAVSTLMGVTRNGADWAGPATDLIDTVGILVPTLAAALAGGLILRRRRSMRVVVSDLDWAAEAHRNHRTHFAVPTSGLWVDAEGRPVPPPAADAEVVTLHDHGLPRIRIIPQPGTAAADLVDAMSPARRLALENQRLRVLGALHYAELQRSRQRIASRAAEERRRIEHDLHDGAQQHLVAAAIHLTAARLAAGQPDDSAMWSALEESADGVRAGLRELRRLSDEADSAPIEVGRP